MGLPLHRLALPIAVLLAMVLIVLGPGQTYASPERWRAEGWTKTDFTRTSIDYAEILSGGPPRDGIPSIDNPIFIPVAKADGIGAKEPVIGLEIGGDARAYPLRIMTWHEIANDEVGGIPVAITYCPLCNSAIVFDRRFDGRVLEFGTTGKLRNSDLVMYDRHSESWWQQFTGEAIVGRYTGGKLETFPARLESFKRFRDRHPQGRIMVPNDPNARDYGRNPYVGYDRSERPLLYDGDMPEGIEPMTRVVVVETEDGPSAVTLTLLREKGEIILGDTVLSWVPGQNSALDDARINRGRDVGNVVARRNTAEGSRDIRYDVTFAFVFHAFHPERPLRKQ